MKEKFDPTVKEAWNILNASIIASYLRYYCTKRFKSALNDFILKYVMSATVTQLLGAASEGYFVNIHPPLRKIKNKKIY